MQFIAKYSLLILLPLPFIALASDALGMTRGYMLRVAGAVAIVSAGIAFSVGGFHQRPNVANLFYYAFCAWPVFSLAAKKFNPSLSWPPLLISVPVMSWYLVNLSMQFYYPVHGGGGGLGLGLGLVLGWAYMVVPFALIVGVLKLRHMIITRTTGEQGGAADCEDAAH